MSSISGKALLVITRLHDDGDQPHYEAHPFIQSCSGGWEQRDCAQEEFQHLEYDVLPLPNQAYKLEPGETIRVSVVFDINYRSCYDHYSGATDVDVDLEYIKTRVLRRQKPRKFYISKGKRHGVLSR